MILAYLKEFMYVGFVAIQRYRFQSHGEQQESPRSRTASAPEEEGRDQGAVHDGRDRGAYDQEEAVAAAQGGDGQQSGQRQLQDPRQSKRKSGSPVSGWKVSFANVILDPRHSIAL